MDRVNIYSKWKDELRPYDLLPMFTDLKCPKCRQKFVQIDRFGVYCTFRNCGWKNQKGESKRLL